MSRRAVVFDLDGVLIDTEGLQYQAWIAALAPLGVAQSKDAYLGIAGRQSDLIAQDRGTGSFAPVRTDKAQEYLRTHWAEVLASETE